ncbi:MAG: metalloregulator ArsR/SmtB family transcription factor [Erysipelotrichaceae bacterium]|nr:metalloregulator ArsR/SmtB family transcription factor [Erysipelotrichaceae bacterium]
MITYNIVTKEAIKVDIKECANMFKAIGDETRLLIIKELITRKEVCACKLQDIVKCNQSTLSHHMKILVDSGVVIARKDWKWVHYSLNKEKINTLINSLI